MVDNDVLKAVGKSREEYERETAFSPVDFNISLADSVDAAIESHITEEDGESDRHKSRVGIYHASGAARCIRKRWYSAKNVVKQEWDKFPAGIGHRGDVTEDEVERGLESQLAHNLIVDQLEEDIQEELSENLEVGNEYPVSEEIEVPWGSFWITGSTDPYVVDGDGNLLEVVEVKSANSPPDQPKWYHEMQLNTYLSILGLESGTIVYIDPSNWDNRQVFAYQQDEKLWELTKLYHTVFHRYRVDDELPPRIPLAEDECSRCAYRGLCIRNDRGDDYTEDNFPPDQSSSDKWNVFRDDF